MHEYEFKILSALKDRKSLNLEQIIAFTKLQKDSITWALDSLQQAAAVKVIKDSTAEIMLSDEGRLYLQTFPEELVAKAIIKASGKIRIQDIKDKIGLNWAKKNGWISLDKGFVSITHAGENAVESGIYETRDVLNALKAEKSVESVLQSKKEIADILVKRKLVAIKERSVISSVSITEKGTDMLSKEKVDTGIGEMTKEAILSGAWKEKGFRAYNINAPVESAAPGRTHPLRDTIDRLKEVFASMGFKEVSGPIIGPAFWAFDALFVQQDHPARTAMDTFYLSNPKSISVDENEMIRVKREHEKAYHEKWSEEVAKQAILRPHTTAISSMRMYQIIKEISQNPGSHELPIKLFTIGRNFRNENIDYKHLTDFYQMDGLIIGEKLTLSNLFDTLLKVYDAMGVKVRFLPSYFPFVEPGVEIQSYRDGEWIEMGGAGMIRKEIVGTSRKKLTVLAWGPGVERILLLEDRELDSITQLYNNGIGWVRKKRLV